MVATDSIAVRSHGNPADTDQGFVVLIVPFGAARSRRIVVPHEVAAWLRDELCAVVGEPEPGRPRKARRPVRLHRGVWRLPRSVEDPR